MPNTFNVVFMAKNIVYGYAEQKSEAFVKSVRLRHF
jgi:hypothetical protein